MKNSAGILMYRVNASHLEVLLIHPGGPYFEGKDLWGIPKGEAQDNEALLDAALREVKEETGFSPTGNFISLGNLKYNGKITHIWANEWNNEIADFVSNNFELEWPANSGNIQSFPEVDAIKWMPIEVARTKIFESQIQFLDRLQYILDYML
jgi:predicted NUDIX family NTP pyrophosphohydrolase